ncbi:hypothetical protein WJX74_004625 [Apatococcus lobatus]|uniref:Protein MCM10 homolog n=1 Tax=Apatococcus lobatus TaxID=904363 RepID=A0AAW1QL74_9CHLO
MEADDCFDMLLALADEASPPERVQPSVQRPSTQPKGHQAAFLQARQTSSQLPELGSQQNTTKDRIVIEPASQLRVKQANLPMQELRSRMASLRFRGLDELSSMAGAGDASGWVTIGVLASKAKPQQTSSGSMMSIWTLGNLAGSQATLFLFGDAHATCYMQTEGSVLAILDGKVKKGRDGQPSLSISSDLQLIRVGTSSDFGFCQGRKRDGQPCRNTVNKSICAFCDCHVQGEYRKMRSARGGFSDSMLQTGVRKAQPGQDGRLLSRTVRLPGRGTAGNLQSTGLSQGRGQAPVSSSDRAGAHQSAGQQGQTANGQGLKRHKPEAVPAVGGANGGDDMVELESDGEDADASSLPISDVAAAAQRKALAIIQARGGLTKPDPNETRPKRPCRQPAGQHQARAATASSQPAHPAVPAGGSNPGASGAQRSSEAGRRAAAPTQQRGAPANKQPTENSQLHGKENLQALPRTRPASKPRLDEPKSGFAAAFGGALEHEAPSATGTRYKQLVEDAEYDKLQAHMGVLAKREEIASRAESLTKLTVQALKCETCGWMGEKRRPECAGHQVKPMQAVKRWWACGHCSHRFTTVALRYPSKRCPKCRHPGQDFKSTSMARPAKAQPSAAHVVASRDQMLARGTEHSFALLS